MRRVFIPAIALALALPALHASAADPEGCVTSNPGPVSGQPAGGVKCTFLATRTGGTMGGSGTWKITVTTPPPKPAKGKKPAKPTVKEYKGTSPVPTVIQNGYKPGDTVLVESLAAGSWAAAGNPSPV